MHQVRSVSEPPVPSESELVGRGIEWEAICSTPTSLQLWSDPKATHIFITLVHWSLVAWHFLPLSSCCRFHSATFVSLMTPIQAVVMSSDKTWSGLWLQQQMLLLSDYCRYISKDVFALGLILPALVCLASWDQPAAAQGQGLPSVCNCSLGKGKETAKQTSGV